MIVYTATKESFMADVEQEVLVDKISSGFSLKLGRPAKSEIRAWQNSLDYMYKVLNDPLLPTDAGVAIEFRLPGTSRRVDFVLSGKNEQEQAAAVIIELKQWERAKAVSGADGLVETALGGSLVQTTHPSYQAWSYAAFFQDYNVAVQETPVQLHPCVYLHNYKKQDPEDLFAPQYQFYLKKAPPFLRGDLIQLRDFLRRHIHYGDGKETLYTIDQSEIRPSKSLQDMLASMLKGNQEFILLDSQKLVFETALLMAEEARSSGQKKILVVEGGPGTGKSVVAINLLVQLTRREMLAQYVTKNSAPRHVYEAKLSQTMRKGRISNLFKTSGIYHAAPPGSLDALIVDESHRLVDKSGFFKNQGEDQTKEIIAAASFSVFFIDEAQKVTIDDSGSIAKIAYFAHQAKAELVHMQLDSQFRCQGSDGYIAWLDDVLEIKSTAQDTAFTATYDFKVLDDPAELKDLIFDLNRKNNKARLLAGYCWDWQKATRADPEHADIDLTPLDFRLSWNLENTSTWAIDPESVGQVGCIHTSQGLEFDYVGVIIGPDLRYDLEQGLVTDFTARARTDQSLKGIKQLYRQDKQKALETADLIIKNTYRTLLTRGMKGCYVYCCDKALADYLRYRLALPAEDAAFFYDQANDSERQLQVADIDLP